MLGSIQIATIRGIPIRIHLTLFIVVIILVSQLGILGLPAGLLLFGSVLAHELGHSIVAQRYGIPIASIDLHLLGGTALMQGLPRRPRQELWIALAGPLVSLSLGLFGAALVLLLQVRVGIQARTLLDLIPFFAAVNLGMALFNLIPALPMDGGRVLRALMAERTDVVTATKRAARISRVISVTFVLFGIYIGGWTLSLLGVVLFSMAGHEVRIAEAQAWRDSEAERTRAFVEYVTARGFSPPWPPPSVRNSEPSGPVIDV